MKKKIVLPLILIGVVVVCAASYTAWNTLDPDYTCAQCHEIRNSHEKWQHSAHASVACTDCHVTALSQGLTSLREKTGMVYSHFSGRKTNEDLSLTEKQALDIANRCASCHRAEHSDWLSGAHSTTYRDIFMDTEHNRMEKPYWDCFRCHSMFYDGDIHSLMSLEGKDAEAWYIKDEKQADLPTITCLACHQVHAEQPRNPVYKELAKEDRERLLEETSRPATALYVRGEKRHLPSRFLTQVEIYHNDSILRVTSDPNAWLCMQCHAPNGVHSVGSEDDKTPVGAYEGMSCLECHNPHSNKVKNEYREVHPKITLK